jgi:hypothetical protein
MNANQIKAEMSGRFKIVATKPDGSSRVVADWFSNLILDAALNRIGGDGMYDRAIVGSGSTPVNASQTSLANLVATTVILYGFPSTGVNLTDGYAWRRCTYRFAAGAAAGNLTEVGMANANGIWSRALIVDGGGTPTTITILSDETLDVTYELRLYRPTSDVSANVVISGVTYATVTRVASFSTWQTVMDLLVSDGPAGGQFMGARATSYSSGALGDIDSGPGGSPISQISGIGPSGSYSNNSLQRLMIVAWGLANGGDPIYNIVFPTPLGIFKTSFSPAIPKDSTKALNLFYTLAWARRTI